MITELCNSSNNYFFIKKYFLVLIVSLLISIRISQLNILYFILHIFLIIDKNGFFTVSEFRMPFIYTNLKYFFISFDNVIIFCCFIISLSKSYNIGLEFI